MIPLTVGLTQWSNQYRSTVVQRLYPVLPRQIAKIDIVIHRALRAYSHQRELADYCCTAHQHPRSDLSQVRCVSQPF
ncbi:hypothetical protein D3C78_1621720 [compost metagenome]